MSRHIHALRFAERQVAATIERHPDYFPIYTTGGRWHHRGELWTDWTGGFLAGMMWQFHRRTGDATWRERAEHYSRLLEHRQHDRNVHDLGFIFLSTYWPWYQLTGDARLHDVLIQAGRTLAMRFMERGQYLRSFVAPESLFIDIMMNVPIIAYAANETGDDELRRVALTHCRTTRDTIVRDDGSTAHEGIFDTTTGVFLRETTHQGLRGDSRWARGLAWSLYGYSKMYGLTGLDEMLEVAERNANFWLEHLPDDGVPFWDFDADISQPAPWGAQKESSAGAIAASGLLHLARQTKSPARAAAYRATAEKTLNRLVTSEYLADETPGWEGILKHGVYHTAKNLGVDESVMWGEYFFVEGLTKLTLPIILIGYRGTGKTTVARLLAERLGWTWIDADDEIERRAGKSIATIFADDGEPAFRDWEQQVVADLAHREQTIVALGGGAILREANRRAIAGRTVAWLAATPETILRRVAEDPATAARRPNLTTLGGEAEVIRLLAEREPLYRQTATLSVDTEGKTPADVAAEIAARLGVTSRTTDTP